MSLTYKTLVKKVAEGLRATNTGNSAYLPGVLQIQAYDTMEEGMPDTPTWQVYPDSGETDFAGNRTERTSFSGAVKQTDVILLADLYTRQRSNMAEDMASVIDGLDAATDLLDAMESPWFGIPEIKALHWSWRRVTFTYGDGQQKYVGIQFTLTFTFF